MEESRSLARVRPSNVFRCYMDYVGTNGAGREFVIVLDGCLFSDEAAFCVSGRISYIIKTILLDVLYCNNNTGRYKIILVHEKYLELTI